MSTSQFPSFYGKGNLDLRGPEGPAGSEGKQGPAGPQGPQGPVGPKGQDATDVGSLVVLTEDVALLKSTVSSEKTTRIANDEAYAQRLQTVEASYVTNGSMASAINAAVTSEAEARVTAEQASASVRDALAATLRTETDTKVSSAITSERSARSTAIGAEAARVDGLLVSYIKGPGVDAKVSAAITAEQSARATAIGAEASRLEGLITGFARPSDIDSKVSAAITSEQQARSAAIGAEASRVDSILTEYARPAVIDAKVTAAITAEQQARSSAIGAEASRVDNLLTGYVTPAGVASSLTAAITAEQAARSTAIGAEASRVDNLLASYNTSGQVDAKVTAGVQQATNAAATALGAVAGRTATLEAAQGAETTYINTNPRQSIWPDGSELPARWIWWQKPAGTTVERVLRGDAGGGYAAYVTSPAAEAGHAVYGILVIKGWYVLEADVVCATVSWLGSGLTVGGFCNLNFSTEPDTNGAIGAATASVGQRRKFTKLVYIDADYPAVNWHAMNQFNPFGAPTAKSIYWQFVGIRPATDLEIKAQQVFSQVNNPGGLAAKITNLETVTTDGRFATATSLNAVKATADGAAASVTTQGQAIAGLNGKTSARFVITADNGTGRAQLSVVADGYGAGVDITGNLRVRGDVVIDGTLTGPKLANQAVDWSKLDVTQLGKSGASAWSGSITPAAGSTVSIPAGIALGTIKPSGYFTAAASIGVTSNVGRVTSTLAGKPYYTDYIADGGVTLSVTDAQGNVRSFPAGTSTQTNLATTEFQGNLAATVRNGNYDTGAVNEGDYYSRVRSATYTVSSVNIQLRWSAI